MSVDLLNDIIKSISVFSVFPIVILGLIFFYRKKNRLVQLITVLSIVSIGSDFLGKWAAKEFHNNMPVFHFYSFFQSIIFFSIFGNVLNWTKKNQAVVIGIYSTLYIANSIFFEHFLTYNSNARIIQTIIFILCSFLYFFKVYQKEDIHLDLIKSLEFWTISGILIYQSGAFYTFLYSLEILRTPEDSLFGSWIIHNLANTTKNFLFFIGLWTLKNE